MDLVRGQERARGTLLLPAPIALLLVPELEEQGIRVFTVAAEAIDSDAQVLQLCLLLGLLLRALFALLDKAGPTTYMSKSIAAKRRLAARTQAVSQI